MTAEVRGGVGVASAFIRSFLLDRAGGKEFAIRFPFLFWVGGGGGFCLGVGFCLPFLAVFGFC